LTLCLSACCNIIGQIYVQGFQQVKSGNSFLILEKLFPCFRMNESLEYSIRVSSLFYSNWEGGENNNFAALLHELRFKNVTEIKNRWKISGEFIHALGFQYFFDSIHRFHIDENIIRCMIERKLPLHFFVNCSVECTSRLFNDYLYHLNDSNQIIRVRNTSFLTPLVCIIHSGLGWKHTGWGSINLGISGAKLTYIRDQQVFDAQGIDEFYGVPAGNKHRFEYGIVIQVLLSRPLLKIIQWDFDLKLFRNFNAPWDVTLQNLIDIRLNRFLKLTFKTKVIYEEDLSRRLQMQHLLSAGFYCRL